jgi:hypothetical protein
METRIWVHSSWPASTRVRLDTETLPDATLRACGGHAGARFDAVWLNGKPMFDTFVVIDGAPRYHSPATEVALDNYAAHQRFGCQGDSL